MGEIIINVVMNVIVSIVEFIMSPFLNALFALFPSLSTYLSYVTAYLTQAFTYVRTILEWFLFTPAMFTMLFDYYVIKYSIFVLTRAIKFAINIYDKLKP